MSQLSMQYTEMKTAISALKKQVQTFNTTTSNMTKNVNSLCASWKAEASPIYRDDYKKLTTNFDKTSKVVEELIKSTEKYVEDMQNLDKAYSKSKVN